MTLAMGILALVYYPLLVMAFAGNPAWIYLIGIPLFAAYCLFYEAGSNTTLLLEDGLAVNATRGGMLKTKKQRLTFLPYKDIKMIKDYEDKILIQMRKDILITKGSLFNKQVITDTFIILPADKSGLLTALRDKGLQITK